MRVVEKDSTNNRIVESICASGASANELEDGASPMHIVVGLHRKNTKQLTSILLQYGGDPNVENEERLTPVHVSVIRGNSHILRLLLRNGGDASKKDEEGRDAWDYALKYVRKSCQRVLRQHLDERAPESDGEQDKYISIFHKDIPLAVADKSRLSNNSTVSSELNRGFIKGSSANSSNNPSNATTPDFASTDQSTGMSQESMHISSRGPRPRPPPRRSKSIKSPDGYSEPSNSSYSFTNSSLESQRTCPVRPDCLPESAETKPSKNILAVLRRTLSPGAKSATSPLSSKAKSNSPSSSKAKSNSPLSSKSKSFSSSMGKSKSRSPLASLLRSSPTKPKLTRAASCVSPNGVKFESKQETQIRPSQSVLVDGYEPKYSRSQSVPCNSQDNYSEYDRMLLAGDIPLSIDATSPDNCIVTAKKSNSSRKRLDLDTVDKGAQKYSPSNYMQTVQKPETDKVIGSPFQQKPHRKSSKSLFKRLLSSTTGETEPNSGAVTIGIDQTVRLSERNPNDSASQLSVDMPSASVVHSRETGSNANSNSSLSSNVVIDSKEMAAIEAGRKVFDVTSPDHCKVVDVDLTHPTPLDKTVVDVSPPPKPRRLFLTNEFTVHEPMETVAGSGSASGTQTPEKPLFSYNNKRPTLVSRASAESSRRVPEVVDLGPAERTRSKSLSSKPSTTAVDKPAPSRPTVVPSKKSVMELKGNLTSELEQEFKAMQLGQSNSETKSGAEVCNSKLNHRWPAKSRGQLKRQSNAERTTENLPAPAIPAPAISSTKDSTIQSSSQTVVSHSTPHVPIQSRTDNRPSVTAEDLLALKSTLRGHELSEYCLSSETAEQNRSKPLKSGKSAGGGLAPKASVSKDSGIAESTGMSQTKREPRSCESEDSFHTCKSDAATQPRHSDEKASHSPLLPTEIDTVQAKVTRMNLEDFVFLTSDDDSESADILNDSKYVTIRPASICASDGTIAEYLHTDLDTNVTLTEARWPITCTATDHSRQSIDWKTFSELSICSEVKPSDAPVVIPRDILYLSDTSLINELRDLGDVPGPITSATRRAYQLRLKKLRDNPTLCTPNKLCGFSRELQQYMSDHSSICLTQIKQWEEEMINSFDFGKSRKWREGNAKMSFTYLLLDPRTTKNLPARHHLLDSSESGEAFRVFLSSVFYIGKGKKTRPYQHFIDAIRSKNTHTKTKQIVDIWKSGLGVVSLHVFHNIIPVEAYTREACMVDAIGLKNLTNIAKCNYYGVATTWSIKKKRLVGSNLLDKAYNILLVEGERQIRPADVRDESELPSFLV